MSLNTERCEAAKSCNFVAFINIPYVGEGKIFKSRTEGEIHRIQVLNVEEHWPKSWPSPYELKCGCVLTKEEQ